MARGDPASALAHERDEIVHIVPDAVGHRIELLDRSRSAIHPIRRVAEPLGARHVPPGGRDEQNRLVGQPQRARPERIGATCRFVRSHVVRAQHALEQPSAEDLLNAVEQAINRGRQMKQLKNKPADQKPYCEDALRSEINFAEIVGQSPALRRVLKEVETVAPTDSTVLIYGESGTGRELVRARNPQSEPWPLDIPSSRSTARRYREACLKASCSGMRKARLLGPFGERIGRFELAHLGTVFLERRGRGDPRRASGQAAAGPSGARIRAGGRHTRVHRRPGDRREQRRSGGASEGERFRERSVLSAQRLSRPCSSVAGSTRGHSAAGRSLCGEIHAPNQDSQSIRFRSRR